MIVWSFLLGIAVCTGLLVAIFGEGAAAIIVALGIASGVLTTLGFMGYIVWSMIT